MVTVIEPGTSTEVYNTSTASAKSAEDILLVLFIYL